MNGDFIEALHEIEREKGISKEIIFEALESALISSYKKNFSAAQNVVVNMDRDTGIVKVYSAREVVEEKADENLEISLEEAKNVDIKYEIGDIVNIEITPRDFGRIAAQTAKQVVIQRIKDAERDVIYDDFINRENEIITGQIQRISKNNIYIDLGKTEGILPPTEQIEGEKYGQGDRLKMIITEVKKTTKGPQIVLSRAHSNLVKRLFELEVPEIFPISSWQNKGVDQLIKKTASLVQNEEFIPLEEEVEVEEAYYTLEQEEAPFEVEQVEEGFYRITGAQIEKLFAMTNMAHDESIARFQRQMRGMGIDQALRDIGAQTGDIVELSTFQFEFMD